MKLGKKAGTLVLALLALGLFVPSAQANNANFSANCKSVTFNWTAFPAGSNEVNWSYTFDPITGANTAGNGSVTFNGATGTHTEMLPDVDGTVTASSTWTLNNVNHSEGPTDIVVVDCANNPPPPPPPPPPSTPPTLAPPVSQVPASGVQGTTDKSKKKKRKKQKKANRLPFTG